MNHNFHNTTKLEIFDHLGKLILTESFHANEKICIEKNELYSGLYFFQLTEENGNAWRGKIIFE